MAQTINLQESLSYLAKNKTQDRKDEELNEEDEEGKRNSTLEDSMATQEISEDYGEEENRKHLEIQERLQQGVLSKTLDLEALKVDTRRIAVNQFLADDLRTKAQLKREFGPSPKFLRNLKKQRRAEGDSGEQDRRMEDPEIEEMEDEHTIKATKETFISLKLMPARKLYVRGKDGIFRTQKRRGKASNVSITLLNEGSSMDEEAGLSTPPTSP